MEHRLSTLFFFISFVAVSQNLIPNSGFEEVLTVDDFQWVQPQGVYFHYEITDSASAHQARTGQYVNGLCMYNGRENEYLHVKLLSPLKQGVEYQFEFYARLMRAKCFNASLQKLIGVHFGKSRLDTHIPGDLHLNPQLNLQLPDSGRFDWFKLAGTYRALGGEEYLTLGYFAATQSEELRRDWRGDFQSSPVAEDKSDDTDKSWLYLPPSEQKKFLREQKKKRRKGEEPNADFAKPKSTLMVEELAQGEDPNSKLFMVRYYFDDFCLRESGDSSCASVNTTETLVKGKVVELKNVFFETDKSTLLEESKIQLNALKRVLLDNSEMAIEIRGYTDNRGEEAYNLDLSLRRAEAVKIWLEAEGVSAERLSFQGFGEADPIDSNDTEAGRTRNRRVSFFIVDM